MQMRKSLIIGIVIASLWATPDFVQPVWAQEGSHAARGEMLLRLIYRAANLTAGQRDQVKQILAQHRQRLQDLRSTLQSKREQIVDMVLGTDPPTMETLQQLVNDASSVQAELAREWHQLLLDVRTTLRPDQLTKVAEFKEQLRTLRHEMRSLWRNQQ